MAYHLKASLGPLTSEGNQNKACHKICSVFVDSKIPTNEHLVPPNCSEERRQLEPELAFWSKFASAKAAHVLFFGASVTTVCLFFFDIGRVLTGLD